MSPEKEHSPKFYIKRIEEGAIEIGCPRNGNGSLSLSSNEIIDQIPDLSLFFSNYLRFGVGIKDDFISLVVSSGCSEYRIRGNYIPEESEPVNVSFDYDDYSRLTIEAREGKASDEIEVGFYKTPLD